MTNSRELREAIRASGIKLEAICTACGMSYSTLRSKIDNKSEFTVTEVATICEILRFDNAQRDRIFFYSEG